MDQTQRGSLMARRLGVWPEKWVMCNMGRLLSVMGVWSLRNGSRQVWATICESYGSLVVEKGIGRVMGTWSLRRVLQELWESGRREAGHTQCGPGHWWGE